MFWQISNGVLFLEMLMSNQLSIQERQNLPEAISLLRAQRQAYSKAKSFYLIRMAFNVIWPLIAISLYSLFNSSSADIILTASSIIVIATFIIEFSEKQLTKTGALIQEQFDTFVFSMKWNESLCGEKVSDENIHHFAELEKTPDEELKNWYTGIEDYEDKKYILKAQRMNVSWSCKQKNYFKTILLFTIVIVFLLIIALGLVYKLLLSEFFIVLFFPALPLFLYLIKSIKDFGDQVKELDRLNSHIRNLLNKRSVTYEELRFNQDAIFIHGRVPNNIVPDKLYWKLRNNLESTFKKINK